MSVIFRFWYKSDGMKKIYWLITISNNSSAKFETVPDICLVPVHTLLVRKPILKPVENEIITILEKFLGVGRVHTRRVGDRRGKE